MSKESRLPWSGPKKGLIMRAIRFASAALVLAAVSTFGASTAQAEVQAKPTAKASGWTWVASGWTW